LNSAARLVSETLDSVVEVTLGVSVSAAVGEQQFSEFVIDVFRRVTHVNRHAIILRDPHVVADAEANCAQEENDFDFANLGRVQSNAQCEFATCEAYLQSQIGEFFRQSISQEIEIHQPTPF
jgi:hypothetical protein